MSAAMRGKKADSSKYEHFDAEAHFDAKMSPLTVRDQGVAVDFTNRPLKAAAQPTRGKIARVDKTKYTHDKMAPLVELHRRYISNLKGSLSPEEFLPIIVKAEMTGAEITVDGKTGIIAEDRKNSIVVVFSDNRTRCYPRKQWDYTFSHDGFDYLFLGSVPCIHKSKFKNL
ncbi:hypothetical protein PAPHI01_0477 [Pancytospora philotis]|nr:hypothetical protein PAPHI01_0477 [Pancytospora philotis]